MKKELFISLMNDKLKLVRTEYRLTQVSMATILGISKKTLVEIEKGRRSLGWTGAVALSTIFSHSSVLQDSFGGELSDMVIAMAFEDLPVHYPKTLGGKVWWKTIKVEGNHKIQQNMISQHYRLLDEEDRRIYASFSLGDITSVLQFCLEKHKN